MYILSRRGLVPDHAKSAYIEGSSLPVPYVPLGTRHSDEWHSVLFDHLDWMRDYTEEGAGQREIVVHQSTAHRLSLGDYPILR